MLNPCTTCSLTCHRKCLLDWFNTIPSDKLHLIHARKVATIAQMRSLTRDHLGDIGIGSPPLNNQTTNIRIDISAQGLENWISSFTGGRASADSPAVEQEQQQQQQQPVPNNDGNGDGEGEGEGNNVESVQTGDDTNTSHQSPLNFDDNSVYILVSCPQCKKDIIFIMRRSQLLTLQSSIKGCITNMVKYGGIFLGITSAVTGVVSMGYIGLTTAGLKMMDNIVPGPMLVRMLTKKALLGSQNSYTSLSRILFGKSASYAVDNLETALVQGLIDPLKFSRIPMLPIVMYRMRTSSIFGLFIGTKADDIINAVVTEFMITGYISSLADHSLIRAISRNIRTSMAEMLKGSFKWSLLNPLRKINLLTANSIISLIVPLRWGYDLLYRLTFNRAYFNLTMKSRPRAIANSLSVSEIDHLEHLNAQLNEIQQRHAIKFQKICKKVDAKPSVNIPVVSSFYKLILKRVLYYKALSRHWWPYLALVVKSQLKFTLACLKFDYSATLSHPSAIIRGLTTIAWPVAASKIGFWVLPMLSKRSSDFNGLPTDTKVLISNILSLVVVALAKEALNLYMTRKKVGQMRHIKPLHLSKDDTQITKTLLDAARSFTSNANASDEIFNYLSEDEMSSSTEIEHMAHLRSNSDPMIDTQSRDFPGNYPA
ncbi:uncharacterized protein LODBEIA_P31770 [Lodderomyces beijingensis]|uniref:RING-CH-type domain-containing protein n=1 Tax=Lodderomyces beijingensis TaxID=1775926 RepID=A0ABP0ZLC0_9ASCO